MSLCKLVICLSKIWFLPCKRTPFAYAYFSTKSLETMAQGRVSYLETVQVRKRIVEIEFDLSIASICFFS